MSYKEFSVAGMALFAISKIGGINKGLSSSTSGLFKVLRRQRLYFEPMPQLRHRTVDKLARWFLPSPMSTQLQRW